jgi:phosphoribosylanthranilate isomerase
MNESNLTEEGKAAFSPARYSPFCTVTGADQETDVGMLQKLDAEIGLLYSATPDGRKRYPVKEWIETAARNLPRVAIHICGSTARSELLLGWLDDLLENAQRVQVNGILSIEDCERTCAMFPGKTIITQHKPDNNHLLAVKAPNHALLVDASGGRGISPEVWLRPDTKKPVGYAGGLGPDNIAFELHRIATIAVGPWWVDMEGKLRVNDWFSFENARNAVWAFHNTANEINAHRITRNQ